MAAATVATSSPPLASHPDRSATMSTETSTSTSTGTKPRIAIIIGSTRNPSVGPHVTAFIFNELHARFSSSLHFEILSLPTLPLFAEPIIPAMLDAANPSAGYTLPESQAWSKTISSYQGFVFVTPQYNWGVPAGLKNALDYLYHEWTGKPAVVVSYGGHGGDKAATMLKLVLAGLRMKVEERPVMLVLGQSKMPAMLEGRLVEGQADTWIAEGKGKLLEDVAKSCFSGLGGS